LVRRLLRRRPRGDAEAVVKRAADFDALDTEIADQIAAQMEDEGIEPPSRFIADGRLHRFGDHRESGWYAIHLDPAPARWVTLGRADGHDRCRRNVLCRRLRCRR
jgi:hypothetical protein